jgi:hypothetical protein
MTRTIIRAIKRPQAITTAGKRARGILIRQATNDAQSTGVEITIGTVTTVTIIARDRSLKSTSITTTAVMNAMMTTGSMWLSL